MSNNKESAADEELLMMVIIIVVLAVIGFFMWHAFKPQITDGLRWLRVGEITVSEALSSPRYGVLYPGLTQPVRLGEMREFLEEAPVEAVTSRHLGISADLAQRHLRRPMGFLLMVLALFIFFKGPHTEFKRVHKLESLMQKQVKAFPYITPLIDFNPATIPNRAPGDPVPVELPLFAEALGPEEWVAYNLIPMPGGKLDEKATAEALAKQLGRRWQNWQKLPPYMQILLAAFAMRSARKRDDSDQILGRLSTCWTAKGGFSLANDRKLLGEARAYLRSKAAEGLLKVLRQHAYVTTAMMRAVDYARSQGGVLSPGQFIWLRGHDRELWYPLNNIGRSAFHPEAMGAIAHFKLEKVTERPVPVPKLDIALAALRTYFASNIARPIPALDYGNKKKPPQDKPETGRKAGIMKPAAA